MNDDFEQRLQQIAPRNVPSAWREKILTAAHQAQSVPRRSPASPHNWLATLIAQLATHLRPQRAAWASLGATWLLIALMNLSARNAPELSPVTSAPSTESLMALQRAKLQLLAELNGHPVPREADRPKPNPMRPHSQRQETIGTV